MRRRPGAGEQRGGRRTLRRGAAPGDLAQHALTQHGQRGASAFARGSPVRRRHRGGGPAPAAGQRQIEVSGEDLGQLGRACAVAHQKPEVGTVAHGLGHHCGRIGEVSGGDPRKHHDRIAQPQGLLGRAGCWEVHDHEVGLGPKGPEHARQQGRAGLAGSRRPGRQDAGACHRGQLTPQGLAVDGTPGLGEVAPPEPRQVLGAGGHVEAAACPRRPRS